MMIFFSGGPWDGLETEYAIEDPQRIKVDIPEDFEDTSKLITHYYVKTEYFHFKTPIYKWYGKCITNVDKNELNEIIKRMDLRNLYQESKLWT